MDDAGSMTSMLSPLVPTDSLGVIYDAWNRPRHVFEDDDSDGEKDATEDYIASYHYDGLGRRVFVQTYDDDISNAPDEEWYYYYNTAWQIVEVHKTLSDTTAEQVALYAQYVWDLRYIDSPAYRERNTSVETFPDAQVPGATPTLAWACGL
jgi:hypothetical protein